METIVGFNVFVLLFQDLFCYAADEAHSLFVLIYLLSLLPQFGEGINEDATHNVTK